MKYKDWLGEWLEFYVKPTTKERTYKKYIYQVKKYITPPLGGFGIDGLTAAELQKFSASLMEQGLAASTINSVMAVLKTSLKVAAQNGITDKFSNECVSRQKVRGKQSDCFSKDEQKKIENYIIASRNTKPNLIGILLCLYTGLRIGELLALTWDDIDFVKGTLTVNKSCRDCWNGKSYVKEIDSPKTQSSNRVIPIPQQIISYLDAEKNRSKCVFVVCGKTEFGAEVRSYQRTFENLLKKLRIPHKGFHAMRHTFATRALECGMDVKTLSEIMGHQNANITLQLYAHSLMEHKIEMMNKVGKLLN